MGAVFWVLLALSMRDAVSEAREVAFVRAQEAACKEAVEYQRRRLRRSRSVGDDARVLWSY